MNSEKVKEIKKAIELCEFGKSCEDCPYHKFQECTHIKNIDTLTLINELESENERLNEENKLLTNKDATLVKISELTQENEELTKQCEGWCDIESARKIEISKLKDRIAELEKENAKLLDSVETVQSNRCVYKCVLTKEHLTKFAERLKEKKVLIRVGIEQREVQFIKLTEKELDEILKEFIK